MPARVQIAARYMGPPSSANGGYACGVVAEAVAGVAARVSLRHPPPLDVPLTRTRADDGTVILADGDRVIAHGAPAELTVAPPDPPPLAVAVAAAERSRAHVDHPFPTCFVCGSARGRDGLRIFPGAVEGGDVVAAPWVPADDLATDGVLDRRVVWAALDCPSGWACHTERPSVLAAMTAHVLRDVRPGEEHIVTGWPLTRDGGRKRTAGSAIHRVDGTPVAVAEALWIELRTPGR